MFVSIIGFVRNREGIVYLKNINERKIMKKIFFHKIFSTFYAISGVTKIIAIGFASNQ